MEIRKIVTHNAQFHTDEIFGCATLSLIYPKAEIIRSRDNEIIDRADIVLDVGGDYDSEKLRFDHHQVEGAGQRENGIPYASFGLIWKHFGRKLVSSDEVWGKIDTKLVQPVDAVDAMIGGLDFLSPKNPIMHPYFLQFAISSFYPTWREGEVQVDKNFFEALGFAKRILEREIKWAEDSLSAKAELERAYEEIGDKRVLVLDGRYPWRDFVASKPEIIFVVHPASQSDGWRVGTVKVSEFSYISRKDLPKEWGGKTNEELVKVSGVPDAVFVHRALFTGGAKTKEGAVAMALKALEYNT